MKRITILTLLLAVTYSLTKAQHTDTLNYPLNSAEKLMLSDNRLTIGGYGEVHYNQPLNNQNRNNGKLDVHRLVLLFGYNFSDRTKFVSEVEFEHVKEVYIEQAFLQHTFAPYLKLRAGLLLIPIGFINEYHEPVVFLGVERPLIDQVIVPTTWREIGFGFTGNILPLSINYQAYLVNGLNGYDGEANFSGSGLRSGRQKGAESFITTPDFTAKVSYYGIRGLNLGVSGYVGTSESSLYSGIDKDNTSALATADSSVVGIRMLGADLRYSLAGFRFRGQVYWASLTNTLEYNYFTADGSGTPNNLASGLTGYYVEAGYNLFQLIPRFETELIPFVRYSVYDTQASIGNEFEEDPENHQQVITTGVGYKLARGAMLKADLQLMRPAGAGSFSKTFNAGIAFMF